MNFDLIVIGGGLVGAGLCAALRDAHKLRIALVDARLPNNEDPRLFALNNGSCQFLNNLGLWPIISPHAAPIHQVHVSNQGHFGSVRLNREDVSLASLGHVVPARYIEAAMNDLLMIASNVTVFRPAKLISLQQQNGQADLLLATQEGEKKLTTSLVIGADGTESTVRAQLNIATEIVDYQQSAIVTRTALKRSHQHIAYERFTPNGAIAMLPLIHNECATIWTADSQTIANLMLLTDEEFLAALQKEFGYRLGHLQKIHKRHVFPLSMVRAEKAIDDCVFLLGNSAHTLHPIAAQGFNLALYEVAALAERLLDKINNNEIFSAADLHEINEHTQKQQTMSIGLSHRLSKIFSNRSLLMSMLVQVGMVSLDVAIPIKKRFIEGIMGRRGSVPRLLLSAKE